MDRIGHCRQCGISLNGICIYAGIIQGNDGEIEMRKTAIISQIELCHALVGRLNYDITNDSNEVSLYSYNNKMKNYTQKVADIKRLRRELLYLQKLLEE